MSSPAKHRWKFHRAGGVDQVTLRDGADLVHLDELDPKLWVALAMPTRGVHLEPKLLDAIDADKDGRVRLPEVLAAVRWATASLKNPDDLLAGGDRLALAAIKDEALRAGAARILQNLGRGDATEITLGDLADTAKIFAATRFNGDGVVPPDSAEDDATRQVIADILTTREGVIDRSGKPGVTRALADAFFAEVAGLMAWLDAIDPAALPLGEQTRAAADATRAVRVKLDDFFTRCRIAAVDPRAAGALSGSDAELAALSMKDLDDAQLEVARLPLARIAAGGALPLGASGGVNPAWSAAVGAFATSAVVPLLGGARASLSFEDFGAIKSKLAGYEAWWAKRPSAAAEKLGLDRLRAIAASDAQAKINGLIEKDLALEAESAQVAAVEKLLLYQRDLGRLLRNFVNFSDFYGKRGAVFQSGTLFLDGRGCNLCMDVSDAAKHGALAAMAGAYLAYCDCTRPGGEKRTIVAAFTDGDSDNLLVGRNGVFFDRLDRDWDATITKIVANPISIREAFWAPYKKVVRLIEEQVGKRAAKADAESSQKLATSSVAAAADKPKPVEPSKIDVGTVAAIGVAVGGIGAMFTGILAAFFGLGMWMPLGIVAVLLLISGPSMLLAFIKLRQRNLGPLLDANGWAINGRARINVPFGGALTDVARLPPGAERSFKDPYADKGRPWGLYTCFLVLVAVGLAWYAGRLDRYLPARVQVRRVLGRQLESASAAPVSSLPK